MHTTGDRRWLQLHLNELRSLRAWPGRICWLLMLAKQNSSLVITTFTPFLVGFKDNSIGNSDLRGNFKCGNLSYAFVNCWRNFGLASSENSKGALSILNSKKKRLVSYSRNAKAGSSNSRILVSCSCATNISNRMFQVLLGFINSTLNQLS